MKLEVGSYVGDVRITKRLYQRKAKGAVYIQLVTFNNKKRGTTSLPAVSWQTVWVGISILLPPIPDIKTPDMMKADDLTLWEIKTNNTGSTNSIDNELRAAKDQSKNVIIRFSKESIDTKLIRN